MILRNERERTKLKNIAIIPARSGSKGLPDKNIMQLNGKPLLVYSIEAALSSGCFDTVMVSTDSEEYADIARNGGAEVPFLRSAATSSDTASSADVILEVLDRYETQGRTFDTFCLLQPTSPLRTDADIVESYRIMSDKSAYSVVSVTELEHPLSWCGQLGEDNSLDGFLERAENVQRQAQKAFFRPNGAMYIAEVKGYRKDQYFYSTGSYAYIMPRERSVDIDTEYDFRLAEFLMNEEK